MERTSAPAAHPAGEGTEDTFYITPVAAAQGSREELDTMAHSRGEGGGTGGTTPKPNPNPSASAGQTPSNMDLAHANRTTGGEEADGETSTTGPEVTVTGAGSVNNPIDLTQEDNALQKALALSLQEMQQGSTGGPQISLEDQELSRALEASLAERQGALQQIGLSLAGISVDPLNPHERQRLGHNPVGLKNIGNTCWFSAVIQSLFHIPEFRSVVLQFQPPALPSPDQPHHHCLLFLVELRRLFALLLATRRKYINPQSAIQALKAAFTEQASVTVVQQDVSEFTHKLLEWIEIAFKTASGGSNIGENHLVQRYGGTVAITHTTHHRLAAHRGGAVLSH